MFIDAPRPSQHPDALDALSEFHDALRDVAAWATWIVADDGTASPRDARWLRAFLAGPLAWHLNDEDAFLFPQLAHTSALLDASLEKLAREREALEGAAAHLAELAATIARGQHIEVGAWREAAAGFDRAVDRALSHEDCVVIPTARLRLGAEERAALRDALVAVEGSRDWAHADAAADASVEHRVYAVLTRRADGSDRARRYTACPRGVSVAVEHCRRCPHAEAVTADDVHAPHVACAIDATPRAPTIADVMTRGARCVERETPLSSAVALLDDAGLSALPVVDDAGRPVGMLSRGDVVRELAAFGHGKKVGDVMTHLAFTIDESQPLARAAQLLVAEGVHRVVVINGDKQLVGVLSTLDVVRALSPSAGAMR